jgi:hypothetical protein
MTAISSVVSNGPAAGCRAIDLRVPGGIDLRLLADRGLDAGDAWFGGVKLSWTSPVGETAAAGRDWMKSFGGGLMVTCGLRNVGVPSEGQGQHGDFTFHRAEVTAVERVEEAFEVRGRIAEVDALGYDMEVRRTWRTHLGEGRVELEDVVVNRGRETAPALQLYHVNLGAPLWSEGSRLSLDASATRPRDADAAPHPWDVCPGAVPGAVERVYEHDVRPGAEGWCSATVHGPGLELEVRWDAATMPRMWQWIHPAPGLEVLGLEPANCSVLGAAHDRAEGRLPELAPGEERRTRLEIRARRVS